MSGFACVCLAYAGIASFGLAMARHYRDVFRCDPRPVSQTVLRMIGVLAVAAALAVAVRAGGWPLGTVQWAGALSTSAFVLVLNLSYKPRWTPAAAALLAAGGLLLGT